MQIFIISFTYHENPTSRRYSMANGISLSNVAFVNETSHSDAENTKYFVVNALAKQLQLTRILYEDQYSGV